MVNIEHDEKMRELERKYERAERATMFWIWTTLLFASLAFLAAILRGCLHAVD